jgi:hypothetical protein
LHRRLSRVSSSVRLFSSASSIVEDAHQTLYRRVRLDYHTVFRPSRHLPRSHRNPVDLPWGVRCLFFPRSSPLFDTHPPPPFHSMIWNVMGHDPQCCAFVSHNDGYSLYYPNGNSAADQGNILKVVQHWYRVTGRAIPAQLPAVACPQPVF